MLEFQHIEYLYALALLPLLIALFVWMIYWRKNKVKKLGDERLVNNQIIGFITGRNTLKFILVAISVAVIIVGWANLRKGSGTEQMQRKGVDVFIALDVSKSMLANDIQPDRLTRAKQLIMSMLDKMKGDRVGLIVFAGRSYLQVPLTIDYSAMKMMVQNVKPDLVPTQGTVISNAIELSMNSFSEKERKYKSLVIISDGEDHDENALKMAKDAVDEGIVIHTVGIGSPQGATLYDPETRSAKLDEEGNPVVSKLNEAELKSIASTGDGSYHLLRNTEDVAGDITDDIDSMEQRNLGTVSYSSYKSYFQYFLIAGLILLLIEWLIPSSKRKLKEGVR